MRLELFALDLRRNAICHDQDLFASPEVQALGSQTYVSSRRALLLELVRLRVIDWTPDVIDAVYAGLNSGIQHAFSVFRGDADGWPDETAYVRAARADIVEAGLAPSYVRAVADCFRETGEPFSTGIGTQRSGSLVLFVDACTRSLAPETGDAARQVLSHVAAGFGELSTGTGGYELYDLGLWQEAATAIQRTVDTLRRLGARTVVTESPEAVVALTRFAWELGIRHELDVQHLSVWLAGQTDLTFSGTLDRRATYHDSSRLGRALGVYEEPRALLDKIPGLDLLEMRYHRDEAIPTGPALGYPYPQAIPAMAARRLTEAMETGADLVIVSSPYAKRNLGLAEVSDPPEICDLIEILAMVISDTGRSVPGTSNHSHV